MQIAPAIRNPPLSDPARRMWLQHPVVAYSGAVLLTAAALLIRFWLDPYVGTSSRMVVFLISTALSAFIFGRGPGIVSIVLGIAAADYFFFPPHYTFHGKSTEHYITMISAVTQGIVVSFCAGYFHRAIRIRSETEARLRDLYETEKTAHEASEESNRLKDYFLAVLSHELRGPLSAIHYCVADRLQDKSLSPDMEADFELIGRNVQMQSRLISDLLDMTRLSRGKMEIELRRIDIHLLVAEAVRSCFPTKLMPSHPAPALALRAAVPWVDGDRDRLFQILWNILRNAGKFTPPEGRIEVETFHPVPGRIAIRIRDNGIGLTEEALDRIFQPFEQAGSLGDKRDGGLGLGLAISRGLAELHGGTLTAASEGPGFGTSFTLEFPVLVHAAEDNATHFRESTLPPERP